MHQIREWRTSPIKTNDPIRKATVTCGKDNPSDDKMVYDNEQSHFEQNILSSASMFDDDEDHVASYIPSLEASILSDKQHLRESAEYLPSSHTMLEFKPPVPPTVVDTASLHHPVEQQQPASGVVVQRTISAHPSQTDINFADIDSMLLAHSKYLDGVNAEFPRSPLLPNIENYLNESLEEAYSRIMKQVSICSCICIDNCRNRVHYHGCM